MFSSSPLLLGDTATAAGLSIVADTLASSRRLDASTFRLPTRWGTITDAYKPSQEKNSPFLILIQDLHANYTVQKNISEVIRFAKRESGVHHVFVEGAQGQFDTSPIMDLPDPMARHQVSDALLKEAYLNGADTPAVGMRPGLWERLRYWLRFIPGISHLKPPVPIQLWGVDDCQFYQSELSSYRQGYEKRSQFEQSLALIRTAGEQAKREISTPALDEFIQMATAYRHQLASAAEYVAYIGIQTWFFRQSSILSRSQPFVGASSDRSSKRIEY